MVNVDFRREWDITIYRRDALVSDQGKTIENSNF